MERVLASDRERHHAAESARGRERARLDPVVDTVEPAPDEDGVSALIDRHLRTHGVLSRSQHRAEHARSGHRARLRDVGDAVEAQPDDHGVPVGVDRRLVAEGGLPGGRQVLHCAEYSRCRTRARLNAVIGAVEAAPGEDRVAVVGDRHGGCIGVLSGI
jgi:hypothetical protein